MADELEIITENDAGTSWVDLVPDEVSTGYQAQNTNIEANRNGIDLSYVRYDSGADEIVIEPSGPIDDNGLPFSVDSEIRFANPGAGTWYLRVIPGSTSLLRSLEITSGKGTWDGSKNGLYDGSSRRVLNWIIVGGSGIAEISQMLPLKTFEIPPDYGDIGTLVTAASNSWTVSTEFLPGTTVAGSTLIVSANTTGGAGSPLSGSEAALVFVSTTDDQSLGLTGTWRLLSRVYNDGGAANFPIGLFQRIL